MCLDACPSALDLRQRCIMLIIQRVKAGEISLTDRKFDVLPKILFAQITDTVLLQKLDIPLPSANGTPSVNTAPYQV